MHLFWLGFTVGALAAVVVIVIGLFVADLLTDDEEKEHDAGGFKFPHD